MEHAYTSWEIEKSSLRLPEKFDESLVNVTVWLLTPAALAELPDGTEVFGIQGARLVKGVDHLDDDTRFGFTAFGLLPETWKQHFGSAVDRLGDLA